MRKGDAVRTETLQAIEIATARARAKWPNFATTDHQKLCILTEEVGEIAREINDQKEARVHEELLDTIAACIRWLEGDH